MALYLIPCEAILYLLLTSGDELASSKFCPLVCIGIWVESLAIIMIFSGHHMMASPKSMECLEFWPSPHPWTQVFISLPLLVKGLLADANSPTTTSSPLGYVKLGKRGKAKISGDLTSL